MRKRLVPSRNAYHDKNRGAGPDIKAKCRTVILGCLDPDLHMLNRSPTPSKLAELVLLQIATAGLSGLVELTGLRWSLWSGDVSTALLQGGAPAERDQPIWVKPPQDGVQALAKTFAHGLYKITGYLYGLASATRTWWQNVLKTTTARGFKHRYDRCLLVKRDDKGLLLAAMIVHVDDFLVTFRQDYDISELEGMFTWGSKTLLSEDNVIIFRGKEIRMDKVDGHMTIRVTQEAFINEMDGGKLAHGRLTATSLSENERKEFRSVAGSLQWLGGQTRPDLCSAVSLANKALETRPEGLKTLFDYISPAKSTPRLGPPSTAPAC